MHTRWSLCCAYVGSLQDRGWGLGRGILLGGNLPAARRLSHSL